MSENKELIEKAIKLKEKQDYEEALAILVELFENNPISEEIIKPLIDVLFSYGLYLNDELTQQYEKAAECFKRIININSQHYRAYYNLGIAYYNLELLDEALLAYDEALKIKPDYEYVYYNKGLIYEMMEMFDEALELYKKALEINPKFVYAKQAEKDLKLKL